MANPVFSRAEAFQPQRNPYQQYSSRTQAGFGQPYGQPGYGQDPWGGQAGAAAMPAPGVVGAQDRERPMTFDDVLGRTGLVLLVIAAVGAVIFSTVGRSMALSGAALAISSIVGFITVLVVSMRSKVPAGGVMLYAACEGVFLGALSAIFELVYPGIVAQAVLGTFAAAGVTLAAYKFFSVQVTPRFRQVVIISTFGFAGAMLINLVLTLFGVNTGLLANGIVGVLASALGVVLAAMNLVVDFDDAEQGVRNQAPVSESWRAAFGIAVTMVWLYTEILRILSYFRN